MIQLSTEGLKFLIKKQLSRREIEVVEQLINSQSQKEVAAKLFVEYKTIKYHMTNIYYKMGNFSGSNAKKSAWLMVILSQFFIRTGDDAVKIEVPFAETVDVVPVVQKTSDELPLPYGKMNGLLEQTVEV